MRTEREDNKHIWNNWSAKKKWDAKHPGEEYWNVDRPYRIGCDRCGRVILEAWKDQIIIIEPLVQPWMVEKLFCGCMYELDLPAMLDKSHEATGCPMTLAYAVLESPGRMMQTGIGRAHLRHQWIRRERPGEEGEGPLWDKWTAAYNSLPEAEKKKYAQPVELPPSQWGGEVTHVRYRENPIL